jgi:hypothetical protein
VRVPSAPSWDVPRIVYLYEEPSTPTLRVGEIAEAVTAWTGIPAEGRPEFFSHAEGVEPEALARRLAAVRVRHVGKPFEAIDPLFGEVRFEARMLRQPTKKVPGVLYDGPRLQALCRSLLPRQERTYRVAHVVFTSRLLGTFGEDGRYHARVNVCGHPNLVSTSGVVEAPAKPKEYYRAKAGYQMAGMGVPFEALKERIEGRFVDYDDPRMTDVLKGYAMQCLWYHIAKEAFCPDPSCRLFNAHWQEEVLGAQLLGKDFCPRHEQALDVLRALRA